MSESLRRQLIATLPISRVKDLEIDNQGFDDQHPRCRHFNMNLVLPALLQRLPKLQSFHYLGPVSQKALTTIVQVTGLSVLHVRTGNDALKVPSGPNPIPTMPWEDVALDWFAELMGFRFRCVIRNEALRDQKAVYTHFVPCARRNGNPGGARWYDHASIDDAKNPNSLCCPA